MISDYRFKARNWQGRKVNGRLSGSSLDEAQAKIRSRGLVPLEIREYRYLNLFRRAALLKALHGFGLGRYSSRDLMIFCRQLATMLKAGIPVLHALNVLAGQMENKTLRVKLQGASTSLEQGSDLAGSLNEQEGYFPPLLVNMVAAGEAGGMLDDILERMALHYENQHDMEEKIRSATAYPLLVTAVALIVVLVMIIFVLPQFAGIFNSMGMEMPLFSRVLLAAGAGAVSYWPLIAAALAAGTGGLTWYAKTEKGRLRLDMLRLRLPLYGKIYSKNIAARFARTLGSLLAGGVTLQSSLRLVDKVIDNKVISSAIGSLSDALNCGETIAGPMSAAGCFPPLLTEMIRVGEETGTLGQTLNRAAVFYEKEVSYIVDRLGTILEPILLLAVGLFIGLLVFSILSPMYQVFQMI